MPTAKRLYALYQAAGEDPCAVYGLVDAWAEELKLTDWYVWRKDTTHDASDAAGQRTPRPNIGHRDVQVSRARREGGATTLDYFADPGVQMAAAMYMVSALKRFAKMERRAILQVATEIAIIGADGIEYGDPGLTYTVPSLPGEQFTVLQMLCLEYVGFRLTEPDLDTQIPLDQAYQQALKLYEAGM